MADGAYERRGPREAELKRLQRLIDERRAKGGDRPRETPGLQRPAAPADGEREIMV